MTLFDYAKCDGLGEALASARQYIIAEIGSHEVPFELEDVPQQFRHLVELVRFFGISVDHVRDAAVKLMPPEFVESARKQIDAIRPELELWLGDGQEWTDAKSAFDAAAMAFPEVLEVTKLQSPSDANSTRNAWTHCAEFKNPTRKQ